VNVERAYLDELTRRLREVLGGDLVGVYVGGSYALGGFEPGRSDLDVAVVVRSALDERAKNEVVAALRHEALPVPARKLELVVYRLEHARAREVAPAFELNLNTGPQEFRADLEPRSGEGHWFAIDRSVLAGNGLALFGPPASEVFGSPPREDLLPALAEVLRWYRRNEPESEDGVLNAGRSLRFAEDGAWVAKPTLRDWARKQPGTKTEIIDHAIAELEGA
jgi:predicted nucleotidyltransferase